jgi:hypothetical protein
MAFSPLNNLLISVEKQGPGKIKKDTFPFRYGKYSEIKTKVRNAFFHDRPFGTTQTCGGIVQEFSS